MLLISGAAVATAPRLPAGSRRPVVTAAASPVESSYIVVMSKMRTPDPDPEKAVAPAGLELRLVSQEEGQGDRREADAREDVPQECSVSPELLRDHNPPEEVWSAAAAVAAAR